MTFKSDTGDEVKFRDLPSLQKSFCFNNILVHPYNGMYKPEAAFSVV